MESLELIKKIAPEILEIIEKRYAILRAVLYHQPVGRRVLSMKLNLKERTIRDEVEILKKQGLLKIESKGMYITQGGKDMLEGLFSIHGNLRGISQLENELKKILNIKKIIIIPGNCEENRMVLKDMGKITLEILKKSIDSKDIIGITGGSTMAAVAEEDIFDNKERDILVIPARGGLGKYLNTQSNSIAAKLAEGLGGSYRLLYIPDNLEADTLEYILKNKEISQSIGLINNIDTLVFGLGKASTMAQRRDLSLEKIKKLKDSGAVAEAFGHFFDIEGREVWEYKTIGLSLEQFKSLDSLIGVAGGEDKAQAIVSISKLNKNLTLITDQSAAKKIFEMNTRL